MDLFSILTLIGGLALFLYGMNAMGDGLAKVSGGKLEKILENLTSNPIKAVLLGAGVTAVIQSSSATTVMVVGFVNSGIMKLSQAVGVIMGANIGTTITSWILSLTGIQSDNFIIQMFKPTSFSPVLAIIGVIFILFINDSKKKDIGTIFIGFAILMYGMDMMSSAVKPLAEVPEFTNLLLKFSNPLLGVIAGALLTAVIQSSSASVGILQALCLTGAVPFSAAIPIIMGQNIGTCVTALLSAIGANKNAKRAAMIHLYFNLIGTVLFMAVFYTVNAAVHFSFMPQAATQPADGNDQASAMANSMKTMNMVMPLMSAFFCFTFPVGLGIYWIATSVVTIIQQLIVNAYMDKVNIDDMIAKNLEKVNKKRAKQGLPPAKVTQNATASLKAIKAEEEKEKVAEEVKKEKIAKQIEESSKYYNTNAKPGSLASKAAMVQKYNEAHDKRK